MTDKPPTPHQKPFSWLWHSLLGRFSLFDDKADDSAIDESLRSGVELKGATPWILIFAIFIASIGLNVNSTAVIIGAMLISPLMGPIMGIGYGLGIYDFSLIRKSFINLGIATIISLTASTLYFASTPLTEAHSELLARTSPTIWDVLIALFGGLAGTIGVTRKEKSNVIPGVAIATALMPPLCTAGYGLANGRWDYFLGAFYLFSINCVYIAASAVLVVGILNPPHKKFVDPKVGQHVKGILIAVVVVTGLPSLYLAYRLVSNEVFQNRAAQFVRSEFNFQKSTVVQTVILPKKRQIDVSLIGERLNKDRIAQITSHLPTKGLTGTSLTVRQAGDASINVETLKEGIVKEVTTAQLQTALARDHEIADLKQRSAWSDQATQIAGELKAQYPNLSDIVVGQGTAAAQVADSDLSSRPDEMPQPIPLLSATSERRLSHSDIQRIEHWFRARTQSDAARVAIN